MKVIAVLGIILAFFNVQVLQAHIEQEEGWFYKYVRHTVEEREKQQKQAFEKKIDGTDDSAVAILHGAQAFNRFVVAKSHQCPVVVKFFSKQNLDSIKVKGVYQEVAESLKKEVSFFAMDIVENRDVFSQIMLTYRLSQVSLPLFLFYKDGRLYSPSHEPTPMVHGYLTRENLENFIKRKFSLDVE